MVSKYDLVNTECQGEPWREMVECEDGFWVEATEYDAIASDAARWRWFREHADRIAFFTATDTVANVTRIERLDVLPLRSFPAVPATVDAAFDAAMASVSAEPARKLCDHGDVPMHQYDRCETYPACDCGRRDAATVSASSASGVQE